MGFWSTLAGIGGAIAAPFTGGASLIPTIAGAAGSALGAAAQGAAQNRGAQQNAAVEQERLQQSADDSFWKQLLAREAEQRASRNDAMRNLQQAEYIKNWAPQASSFSPYTRQLTGPSATVREGASTLSADMLKRLSATLPEVERRSFTMPNTKPGLFERIAGIASPVLTGYGTIAGANDARIPGAADAPSLQELLGSRPQ